MIVKDSILIHILKIVLLLLWLSGSIVTTYQICPASHKEWKTKETKLETAHGPWIPGHLTLSACAHHPENVLHAALGHGPTHNYVGFSIWTVNNLLVNRCLRFNIQHILFLNVFSLIAIPYWLMIIDNNIFFDFGS
ncbi:uncharacterized protein LOC131927758 [Physella acuta]|uniref:uncharacterized protein LOC131927758 n=1 Tax=Physella acuta TaxID=109671 RepID=UPI0027DE50F5|nr:uncharacterized protein LOC131927758 [Physella acuta]